VRAHINGTDLFYELLGDGRPLLLIHGGLGLDHTCFLPWLLPLANKFQLVLPDLRGNGRSSRASLQGVTHATWAHDLDALRMHLGFPGWAVLGHSYGSYIAQELALLHGASLTGLVLSNSTPAMDYPEQIVKNAKQRGTPEQVQALLGALGGPPVTDDAAFGAGWETVLPMYFHHFEEPYRQAMRANVVYSAAAFNHAFSECVPSFDNVPRLGDIRVPTLILAGRHDFITPVEQGAQRLAAGIPGAVVAVFENSGHFPFIEERDGFVSEVSRWLSALPPNGNRASAQSG
jgi:proline iminopeptidase